MKRITFFVMIMISLISSTFPQKPDCIFCGNNVLIETSSAIGDSNQNFGEYSLTIGKSNTIAENLRLITLIGTNNVANGNLIGNNSGAFGMNNLIQSDKSYIIGNDDTVSAEKAITIGNRSKASGPYSLAIGKDIKVSGFGSVGLGINSRVSGNFSAAIGNNAYANAMNSYSFGNNVWSDACGSITIGTSPIFLKNTTPNSLVIGFNSSVPTLFVSSSDGSGTTGKVGIGNITSPTAKLHIRADAADSATIRLEHGIGKVSRIYFSNTNDYFLQAANNQNMIFRTPFDRNFNFKNGNIGVDADNPVAKLQVKNGDIFIEDIDRGIIMKSPDGNCWRGTLDNTGSLHFVQVNCDDLVSGQVKPQSEIESQVRIYPNPAGDKVFVSIDPSLSGARLEITDVSGIMIHTERLVNPESYMDMTSLKSGIYVFSIISNNGNIIETMKVMKE